MRGEEFAEETMPEEGMGEAEEQEEQVSWEGAQTCKPMHKLEYSENKLTLLRGWEGTPTCFAASCTLVIFTVYLLSASP